MRNVLLFFFIMRFNGWSRDEREQKNIIFLYLACVFIFGYCVRILQMILRFFNDSFLGALALLVVYSELRIWS